jgi:cell filamentation protein
MFDHFGDNGKKPYLRNRLGIMDPANAKILEALTITKNIPLAFERLAKAPKLHLAAWLGTHKTLLGELYPWAGSVRKVQVARGTVKFHWPSDIRKEADIVFRRAENKTEFLDHPGQIYGEAALVHPVYDGNGRSLNTTFAEIARRHDVAIRWDEIDRTQYLDVLTKWIHVKDPAIDAYFKSHMIELEPVEKVVERLQNVNRRVGAEAR